MRSKSVFFLAAIASAVCWCYFAEGQNREKTIESAKVKSDAAANSATTVQPKANQSAKPADAGKKPAEPPKPAAGKPAPVDTDTDDEKTIRASAIAFVNAYNDHDSKAVAALFAQKAEMIDDDKQVVKGRNAIEKAFASVFEANPKIVMQIDVESLRVLTPSLAIEEGTTRSKNSPDHPEDVSTYVAIHVKVDGKWLLACVRDWDAPAEEPTPHDRLEELSWLVGDWVEESSESVIRSSCQWHDNGNFLIQEFNVQFGGKVAMSGTMRIGWDAVRKQFKSWVFDSKGGYVEGYWLRDGKQWIVKSQGATAVGEAASATTVYVPVDDDTVIWSSFNRVVDGELQDEIAPVVVKRRPPSPTE